MRVGTRLGRSRSELPESRLDVSKKRKRDTSRREGPKDKVSDIYKMEGLEDIDTEVDSLWKPNINPGKGTRRRILDGGPSLDVVTRSNEGKTVPSIRT